MKAICVEAFVAPPVLREVPVPERPPGHTLVEMCAATVGHIDRTIWSGRFLRHPPLPYTPGVEGSGVVVASETYASGERVWIRGGGLGTAVDGTWAEQVVAPDSALGLLPHDVSFPVGAAFFSPCTSAWTAVHVIGELRAGQRVIVTGATGAVGAMCVQLATEVGADVVATVSRRERLALLPAGVTGVVVDGASSNEDDVEPADVLIDTVGGPVLEALLRAVHPGGRAVLVGYLAGPTLAIDLPAFLQRDVSLLPLNMIRRESQARAVAGELLQRLADGRLSLDVTSFAFDQSQEALDWLVRPGHVGRAVLLPQGVR